VVGLTDAAGAGWAARYRYDVFGAPLETQGTLANPHRYAGRRWAGEIGLYDNRARWYDPVVGRFASADPLRGALAAPAALHPYAYVGHNPVNLVDPPGLGWLKKTVKKLERGVRNVARETNILHKAKVEAKRFIAKQGIRELASRWFGPDAQKLVDALLTASDLTVKSVGGMAVSLLTGFPTSANDYDWDEVLKAMGHLAERVAYVILDLGNGSRSAEPDPRNYDVEKSDDTYKQDGKPEIFIEQEESWPHGFLAGRPGRGGSWQTRARGAKGGAYAKGGALPLRVVDPHQYTLYVTRYGKKYHRGGCRYLRKSSIPITLYDAVRRGYTPDKVCRPPVVLGEISSLAPAAPQPAARLARRGLGRERPPLVGEQDRRQVAHQVLAREVRVVDPQDLAVVRRHLLHQVVARPLLQRFGAQAEGEQELALLEADAVADQAQHPPRAQAVEAARAAEGGGRDRRRARLAHDQGVGQEVAEPAAVAVEETDGAAHAVEERQEVEGAQGVARQRLLPGDGQAAAVHHP
jgi:RHS repeat-associated protein